MLNPQSTDGKVVVAEETGGGLFQVRVRTGEHSFLMDEPSDRGGLATGPDPFDLLCAAVGACTLMTMKLYARRKGWVLDGFRVRVTHRKGSGGERDRFERVIELGDATDEQREGLFKIAERCPVHQLLEHGADVTTSLTRAEPTGCVPA
jgi:putative redox protein